MKATLHLVWIRLSEQPAKILYLVVTLAAGILTWVVLSAFASPRLFSNTGDAIQSSLFIHNSRVQFDKFPLRYIPRIQQMQEVDSVVWFDITGYACNNATRKSITITGYGGNIDRILRDAGVSEFDLTLWHKTENGVLAGPEAANRCGLNPGITVSPKIRNGNEIPLQVVAILPERGGGGIIDESVYAHYDYLNRFLSEKEQDKIISATAWIRDPATLDKVAVAIEREFQSSDPPLGTQVYAETSIIGRFGQVQGLLLLIIGSMVPCVLLVFCAVLAHFTSQRRASMAVLQTLGFTGHIQFSALFLEITSVVILGTALGIATGYGALALLAPWVADTLLGPALRPVDGSVLVLLPALLLLLVITLIWPGVQIAKLKPMDYLRI